MISHRFVLLFAMAAHVALGQSVKPTSSRAESQPDTRPSPAADTVPLVLSGHGLIDLSFDSGAKPSEANGGGLVGKINEVAREIAGAGGGAKATATIRVEAFVHERVGSPWRVSLKVGQSDIRIPAQVPGETSVALRRELALFTDLLGIWEVNLSDGATLELKLKGACDVVVERPYESLKKWKGTPVTLRLVRSAVPEVDSIRLFIVGPQGLVPSERVPRGVPIVVEVVFNRPPRHGEHLVELTAGQGVVKVVAQRVDKNPTRFMTPIFVVRDDGGLPAMTPVAPTDGRDRR